MAKTFRCIALILVTALLCGMIQAAGADVVSLGIYFCGRRTAADGSQQIVKLEGRFRVTQNGEEAGIISAGENTLTLGSTERIRIEPIPESIAPEWDLSTVAREVSPEAGGTTTISIVVEPLKADASIPTPAPTAEPSPVPEEPVQTDTPEPPAEPDEPDVPEDEPDVPEDEPEDEPESEPEDTKETDDDEPLLPAAPVVTPTMPPYDLSSLAPTPEPEWKTLPAGSGSVRAFAYYDQIGNGQADPKETGVKDVTVCLFTEEGEAVSSAKTAGDGYVRFDSLPEGRYRIKAILPKGWAFNMKGDAGNPYAGIFSGSYEGEAMSDAFSVSADSTATPGIALKKSLHVSGTCWFETTIDGLYDNAEQGLPGVRIELDGEKNGLHYETVSDKNGNWYIDRVAPAAYKLTAHAPDGMMFTRVPKKNGRKTIIARDGVSSASHRVDLNDASSKNNLYIGFTWAGRISGICFLDANYNGLYDEGELPMPGVKINAIKQAKDESVATVYSGEDGRYVITGLRANTYRIRAVLPEDGSDFTKVVSNPLGNHFQARPGRRENFWKDFTLQASEQREVNVGVIYPASVSGTVYKDDDFSGTLNGRENIVSGYLVKLYDENGTLVTMDKTSVKGKYELTDVPPGNYYLSVTALKNYAFTKQGEGNVILNRTNGEGYSEMFHLDLKENRKGMDIGMILPGTVRGSVFADKNDNGIRDNGEEGLPGTKVRLMGEEGEAFAAEIGADGTYLFDAVMPGTYYLEYDLPENAVFARVADGGNTISGDGKGQSASFEMSSGIERTGPVCGALTLGRIDGCVYQDHDGNGIRTDDEEAIAGLTITLTPSRDVLEEITVTAGEDGVFALPALRPDEYTLTVACPDQYVLSRTDNLKLPLSAGKETQSVTLSVAMGAVWNDQQIGTVIPAALSGQLWLDENNNGLFDADESMPAGYEITVTDNRTGRVFDTLRTDENGRYATSGMIPGSFTLSFPLDGQTIAPKPGNSDFREENGKLVLPGIELVENEHREGLMLGIVRYTSIGGKVWMDRGGTVQALSGAEITLKDGDGNTLQVLASSADGGYRFEKLMPGTYRLEAAMPEGCVIIEPGDPRLNGEMISVMSETLNRTGSSDLIELKMAQDRTRMDIGCVLPGRAGDFCWLDLDGDGLQGMDEPGIPNVKIVLQRDGETVAETVTDQYGFYRFNDLYPAVYTLQVTPPEEVKPTVHRTDIPLIASVLEDADEAVCVSAEFTVESDKGNYNADIGFVCRRNGIMPAGVGEGKTQIWKAAPVSED
ncbi:MAG: hypothetical protein IKE15_06125 [Clostridia bacterium]|nr:hypothetical protein [Clostridia bacterium]